MCEWAGLSMKGWSFQYFQYSMSIRGEDWPSNEQTLRDKQVFAHSQDISGKNGKAEGHAG